MRRVRGLVCALLFVLAGAATAGAGAASSSQSAGVKLTSPAWSLQAAQVVAGQPFSVRLDPRGARTCWVGLTGPSGFSPVGWKFDVRGRQLNLTLLTQAGAAPGPWSLTASCKRAYQHLAKSTMSIRIVSGGTGPLVSHGDMRVAIVAGKSSPPA